MSDAAHDPWPQDTWQQIADYLAGAGMPSERTAVEEWLRADPGRLAAFERVKDEWNAKPALRERSNLDTDWARIASLTIAAPTSAAAHSMSSRTSRTPTRARWTVAGSLVAVGVVALLGTLFLSSRRHAPHTRTTTYRTALGQRTTVSLSDGTLMALAPATTARVTATMITVDGEAYFTVAPNAVRPIVVHTRNVVIQVLGTRFWVRQYTNDRQSRVVVDDGKVGIRPIRASVTPPTVLSARMMAQISDSGIAIQSGIATQEYTGAPYGKLVFRRAPLRDVTTELSRSYGPNIRVADSVLADETISANVDVQTMSLTQVLDFICTVMHARYVTEKDTILVLPGRIGHVTPLPKFREFHQPIQETMYGR